MLMVLFKKLLYRVGGKSHTAEVASLDMQTHTYTQMMKKREINSGLNILGFMHMGLCT